MKIGLLLINKKRKVIIFNFGNAHFHVEADNKNK